MCVALVGDQIIRVWPQLGIPTPVGRAFSGSQTPVCSPSWASKRLGVPKHLCVAPIGDPKRLGVPKHLCVTPFWLPWSRMAFVQVVTMLDLALCHCSPHLQELHLCQVATQMAK